MFYLLRDALFCFAQTSTLLIVDVVELKLKRAYGQSVLTQHACHFLGGKLNDQSNLSLSFHFPVFSRRGKLLIARVVNSPGVDFPAGLWASHNRRHCAGTLGCGGRRRCPRSRELGPRRARQISPDILECSSAVCRRDVARLFSLPNHLISAPNNSLQGAE